MGSSPPPPWMFKTAGDRCCLHLSSRRRQRDWVTSRFTLISMVSSQWTAARGMVRVTGMGPLHLSSALRPREHGEVVPESGSAVGKPRGCEQV